MEREQKIKDGNPEGMLQPYRVLDLTDHTAFMCGKVLADLGADVIKIEKPGGDRSRKIGPFYKDIPDPEKSLYWLAFNVNKRGITLDIESADGQELFKRLVKTADFVIESFPRGYLDSLGLGYSDLSRINPKIIMTSITPFGQNGPYKEYVASDLVIEALSGLLYVTGDSDRAPVRASFPQSYLLAGSEGAVGSILALNYRRSTGEGQHVDISMLKATFSANFDNFLMWGSNKVIQKRQGSLRARAETGVTAQQIWQCKDGYISFYFFGGPWTAKANKKLVEQMDKDGCASDYIKQIKWENLDWSKLTQSDVDKLQEPTRKYFQRHTKKELFEMAMSNHIMLCPVNNTKDILDYEQLHARHYWINLEHDELGATITYPGEWIKASETPVSIRRRAPTIGEHNWEIYGNELGLSKRELVTLKGLGVI